MKNILTLILILFATNCFAGGAHDDPKYKVTLLNNPKLEIGKAVWISFKLEDDTGPLAINDLKIVHTKPLHLLVIDPSLTDYQHIHPASDKIGIYSFEFTPKINCGGYRAWADITSKSGKHQYVLFDIGKFCSVKIDKTTSDEFIIDGLKFSLKFDYPLKAGEASMGHITVEKNGKPFTQLEPVMGAFAHIVAFPESLDSVLHVHPMGAEPSKPDERGGPQLDFHIEPHGKGYIKLFVQVKVDGKDIFAPFGLNVE